jgi:hypothetical protein
MNPNLTPNLIADMTYKVSQRERAIGALFAVLGQLTLGQALGPTLGSTLVKRNSALPERLSDHAMAILRDGEMGEPELTLSPVMYHWQHETLVELFVADPDAARRDARMDALLTELATLIEMDRTLGDVVNYCEIGPPKFDELGADGTSGIKACSLSVVLHYSSAGPLS